MSNKHTVLLHLCILSCEQLCDCAPAERTVKQPVSLQADNADGMDCCAWRCMDADMRCLGSRSRIHDRECIGNKHNKHLRCGKRTARNVSRTRDLPLTKRVPAVPSIGQGPGSRSSTRNSEVLHGQRAGVSRKEVIFHGT